MRVNFLPRRQDSCTVTNEANEELERHQHDLTAGKHDERAGLGEESRDALNEYVAEKISDPVLCVLGTNPITVDNNCLGAAAQQIDDFVTGVHDIVFADPSREVTKLFDVDSSVSDVTSEVLAKYPLPIDHPLEVTKRTIRVTEVAVGAATGQHQLVVDGIRGLFRDFAVSAMKEGTEKLEQHYANVMRGEISPPHEGLTPDQQKALDTSPPEMLKAREAAESQTARDQAETASTVPARHDQPTRPVSSAAPEAQSGPRPEAAQQIPAETPPAPRGELEGSRVRFPAGPDEINRGIVPDHNAPQPAGPSLTPPR